MRKFIFFLVWVVLSGVALTILQRNHMGETASYFIGLFMYGLLGKY